MSDETQDQRRVRFLCIALRDVLIADGVLEDGCSPSGPELLLAAGEYTEHIKHKPPRVRLTIEDLSPREAEAVRMEADARVQRAIARAEEDLKKKNNE